MEKDNNIIPSIGEQMSASLDGKSIFDQEEVKEKSENKSQEGEEEDKQKEQSKSTNEADSEKDKSKDAGDSNASEGKEEGEGSKDGEGDEGSSERGNDDPPKPTGYDLAKFKEEAGEEFETPEDVIKAYKELKEKDPLEGQPFLQKLRDLSKDGHTITPEFINEISVDYKSMNPDEPGDAINLIKAKLKLEETDLSPEKIDFLAKQKMFNEEKRRDELAYRFDIEPDSEKINGIIEQEKKDHNLSLSIEASKAHKTLSEYQDKLVMPKQEQSNEDIDAKRQKFENNVSEFLKTFKGISDKVGKDEVVELNLDEETAKTVQTQINHLFDNPSKFFEKYGGVKGAAEMVARMEMKDSLSKEIEKRVASLTEERISKELKNQKSYRDVGTNNNSSATSTTRAIADAFTQKK